MQHRFGRRVNRCYVPASFALLNAKMYQFLCGCSLMRGDLGFDHLKHSFAAGLTLRAGGFPMVSLMFAWGGPEGHHNIFNMNSSLLGGSARPLLD